MYRYMFPTYLPVDVSPINDIYYKRKITTVFYSVVQTVL